MAFCECTIATEIESIPDICNFKTGDIIRAGIRRAGQANAASGTVFKTAAYWTPLLNPGDATKVVFTPKMWEVVFPEGDFSTEPGHDGAEEVYNGNAIVVAGHFRGLTGAAWTALDKMACEPNVDIMFLTTGGNMIADDNGGVPRFFSIQAQFSIGAMGKSTQQSYRTPFRFTLPANWAKGIQIYQPTDFNAKSFLKNP